MFTNLEPLDKNKHANLKLKPGSGYHFASKLTYSHLAATEMAEAAKYFPIVFPGKSEKNETMLPLALLSLGREGNDLVADNGQWKAGYIPHHIKRYPFIFAALPEKENQFVIMVDKDDPKLNETEGMPLFNEKGEPGEIIERLKKFLTGYQVDIERTRKLLAPLEEKEVLVTRTVTQVKGDEKKNLVGFRVVDEKKLAALDDATIAQWFRSGLLGIIYSHLSSMSNFRRITPERNGVDKNRLN